MYRPRLNRVRALLFAGCAAIALSPALAKAEPLKPVYFSIPAQELGASLNQFARQSEHQIVFSTDIAVGHAAPALQGELPPERALAMLLEGTGLTWRRDGDAFLVTSAADPQSGSAAGDGADQGTVAALIVTAQKKEEAIQDVPIAISAFTEKSLQEQKIEGGFDLLKAIPNVTFSKNNFTSYNFSIRGIGTKAVSATTDPGVAVSFNNIALLQNRLFEQEYFDVERVEVLRGPQGTLYGRNATAGVINVISAKPKMNEFDGWLKGEVGNYHSKRISAMVNVPLIEDKLAVRLAGSLTDRQGYDYNSVTKNHVNGRDLWSGRITIGFNPTEHIRSNLVWERFNEDDNRSRTGKQLCHRDSGLTQVGGFNVQWHDLRSEVIDPATGMLTDQNLGDIMGQALFSQGCKPGSLYEDAAFGTPNGLALPFVFAMSAFGQDCGPECGTGTVFNIGYDAHGLAHALVQLKDPYGGMMQSRDLRTIASFRDPRYRAKADVVEFNIDFDLTPGLTLTSQTAYNKDTVYSFQDFNRFNTVPIFTDTASLYASFNSELHDRNSPPYYLPFNYWVKSGAPDSGPSIWASLAPGGQFCDPQLGCSNTLAGFDISQAKGTQFTEELRLQSSFDGPLNFSVGANYTRFQTLVDYYVFYNLITAYALMMPFNRQPDMHLCSFGSVEYGVSSGQGLLPYFPTPIPSDDPNAGCPYIDPNPIESINGEGHNYFRSKNPYRLKSWATFGEAYWQATNNLKVTAGLRYTDDHKRFIPVPSQILMGTSYFAGGAVSKGYPEDPPINQRWGEFTGRLGVDWKPRLTFTDQTMVYAFYSRGYKGGGANPPSIGFNKAWISERMGLPPRTVPFFDRPFLNLTAVNYPDTFKPEFVNAFEVGAKNTLMGGGLMLNGDVFLYDYKDYQVSKIVDRTAVNENFDAKVWGLELELRAQPTRNFSVIGNLGYLDTAIGSGARSINIMNRTQGNPNYTLVKPWVQLPSNCVVPTSVVVAYLQRIKDLGYGPQREYYELCGGWLPRDSDVSDPNVVDANGNPTIYDEANYPEINGGAGLYQNLKGNELPNSPHWTANIGAQYSIDFANSWKATIRGDAYWQSQSWARVYNDNPYDKLHGWYNVNLSAWVENHEGLKIEVYAKNLLDKTPITDAFLNSDDTALTTNVFVLDPRLIGLSIKKDF